MRRRRPRQLLFGALILSVSLAFGSPAADHVRHPAITGAPNFRDLGGYATADGRTVKWGQLYRSDALSDLTELDTETLEHLKVARVVDFRTAEERSRNPDRLPADIAVHVVSLPVGERSERQSTEEVTRALNAFNALDDNAKLERIDREMVRMYPLLVRDYTREYSAWLHGLLDTAGAAQVFHCTGGADRTGFAAAVLLLALGVPRDTVMYDYLLTNVYLYTPKARDFLDARTTMKLPASMQLRARYLQAALDEMEKDYGSIEGYLRDGLRIDADLRNRLRDRYLE